MELIPVIARIVLRYASGALVAYGFIPQEVGAELAMDQEVALILGAGIGIATEGLYAFAKRKGWAT
jgi:hypothetical protein